MSSIAEENTTGSGDSELPTLFKYGPNGELITWRAELDGQKYRTIDQEGEGDPQVSEWVVCEAKNVGRRNERTPEQQALFEVESLYRRKVKNEGFLDSDEDTSSGEVVDGGAGKAASSPLCSPGNYTTFPGHTVSSQPIYKGDRCFVTEDGVFHENGDSADVSSYLLDFLKGKLSSHEGITLESILVGKSELVIYDIVDPSSEFNERYDLLVSIFSGGRRNPAYVAPMALVDTGDTLDRLYDAYVNGAHNACGQYIRLHAGYSNENVLTRPADLV